VQLLRGSACPNHLARQQHSAEHFAENFRDRDRRLDGKEKAVQALMRAKEQEQGLHKKRRRIAPAESPCIIGIRFIGRHCILGRFREIAPVF
jgi:hypothetical protein